MRKIEKRSLFQKIFGKEKQQTTNYTQLKMMNGYTPTFYGFSGEAYDSDVVRSAVDAIARNAAKLKPKHIRRVQEEIQNTYSHIEKMLTLRPNPYMDAYSFLYKVITQLYMKNNSFVYIHTDDFGVVKGFYPLNFSSMELLESGNEIYAKFNFMGGQQVVLPYTQLIHLRRFFYKNDLYGETSDKALNPTLDLIRTTDEGISNAIKSSAYLRGLLKFTASLRPEDIKAQRDAFVEDYMSVNNNGGIAAIDSKTDYTELKTEPKMIDSKQMTAIKEKVYEYYGVNEKIIKSNYSEEEWNAFYESVLEPIAIQLSLEFTSKLFTDRERGHGSEIIFEANRLQYASNSTKISVVTMLMDRGMMTQNQGLEVFNLPPIEGGDKRILSLNFVDADKANEYQLGKQDEAEGDDKKDDDGNDQE